MFQRLLILVMVATMLAVPGGVAHAARHRHVLRLRHVHARPRQLPRLQIINGGGAGFVGGVIMERAMRPSFGPMGGGLSGAPRINSTTINNYGQQPQRALRQLPDKSSQSDANDQSKDDRANRGQTDEAQPTQPDPSQSDTPDAQQQDQPEDAVGSQAGPNPPDDGDQVGSSDDAPGPADEGSAGEAPDDSSAADTAGNDTDTGGDDGGGSDDAGGGDEGGAGDD